MTIIGWVSLGAMFVAWVIAMGLARDLERHLRDVLEIAGEATAENEELRQGQASCLRALHLALVDGDPRSAIAVLDEHFVDEPEPDDEVAA